jgi:predicted helicase
MAASRFSTFLESFDADPKRRGTQWENVCKWFLETDPVYRTLLKKVWLWNKWPGRWGPDAGIDLVAQAKDGTYWAIQAKAYAPENTVTKQDMNKFLAESARSEIDHRLLIATTRHVSSNATRACKAAEKPVRFLLRHDLDHREGLSWPVSYAAWAKGRHSEVETETPTTPSTGRAAGSAEATQAARSWASDSGLWHGALYQAHCTPTRLPAPFPL